MFEIRSKRLAKKRLPRRSMPGSAKPFSPKRVQRKLPKISAKYGQMKASARFEKGCEASLQPELRPVRAAAHALLRELSLDRLAQAETVVLSAAQCMLNEIDEDLTPGIVLSRGLSDAVDAIIGVERFAIDSEGSWDSCRFVIEASTLKYVYDFHSLRRAICAAEPGEYQQALERAKELRATLPFERRTQLGYVFPDAPWADEDLAAFPNVSSFTMGRLLSAASDLRVVRDFLGRKRSTFYLKLHALDLAAGLPHTEVTQLFGELLPGFLEKKPGEALEKGTPRAIVDALSCIRNEQSAEILAPYLANAIIGPQVLDFFRESPEFLAQAERQAHSPAARAALATLARPAATEPKGAIAAASLIPSVLRERPWRPRKRRAKARVVSIAPKELAFEERIEPWTGSESPPPELVEMSPELLERWRARLQDKRRFAPADFFCPHDARTYARVPDAEGLDAWNRGLAHPHRLHRFLTQHGSAAIEGFLHHPWTEWFNYQDGPIYLAAAQRVRSPRLAPTFAYLALRRKQQRKAAERWLLRDPRLTAIGLIPDAVGPTGAKRANAEHALLLLARDDQAERVQELAAEMGEEIARVIEELLARDPLAIAQKAPKAPDFLDLSALPAVRIGEARLPTDAVDALLEMLRAVPVDPPYPGLAPVIEACEPASLEAFVRALIDRWISAGAPGRHDWMLRAAAAFPSEENTRKVGLLLRAWGSKKKAWAERASEVLAALGSDHALLHLAHVAETTRFAALRDQLAGQLQEIAERRELSMDELGDRTVPDLGLDPDGTLTLAYGERSFRVGIDESLGLTVRDASGQRIRTLPPKRKGDDAEQVKAAKRRFKGFKADLAAIADRQRRRLERCMVSKRSWPAATFRQQLSEHPVVFRVARGLVWLADERPFRVAEDRSFADIEDELFDLPEQASVRIAHPLELGEQQARWTELFLDYELVQAFEQLGRSTFAIRSEERAAQVLERSLGLRMAGRKMIGFFESRGWDREGHGAIGAWTRRFGAWEARLPLSPGIQIAYLDGDEEQELQGLELREAETGEPASFGALEPLFFSELVRDLESLRARMEAPPT